MYWTLQELSQPTILCMQHAHLQSHILMEGDVLNVNYQNFLTWMSLFVKIVQRKTQFLTFWRVNVNEVLKNSLQMWKLQTYTTMVIIKKLFNSHKQKWNKTLQSNIAQVTDHFIKQGKGGAFHVMDKPLYLISSTVNAENVLEIVISVRRSTFAWVMEWFSLQFREWWWIHLASFELWRRFYTYYYIVKSMTYFNKIKHVI